MSLIIFLPAVFALILAFFPRNAGDNLFRFGTLAGTLCVLAATVGAFFFPSSLQFDPSQAGLQNVELFSWIGSKAFTIDYFMGIDGISFPLIVLTAGVSVLAMIASWSITKQVKGFCILFLLLETGMLGVFLALDFFLFYIFWEVMLLPMYFLIGIWGGPRKEYAAIKFFLYTLFGSVLMLIAILMLYFASDLNVLDEATIASTHVVKAVANDAGELVAAEGAMEALAERGYTGVVGESKVHTFNIMALAAMAQNGSGVFDGELLFGWKLQHWAFLLLFIGFAIKVPSVPVHTWLPDAHVEAPHADLHDPGWNSAEDGRVRDSKDLLSDMPGGRVRLPMVCLHGRRGQYGLWCLRGTGAERLQANGGLQLGEPHGICRVGAWCLVRRTGEWLCLGVLGYGH